MKIFLIILLFSTQVLAFFERGLSAAAGSNPAGGSLTGSLAYNYKAWDTRTAENGHPFWMYGYVRPKISYETSFYINSLDAEIQIYPISIFGVTFGTAYVERAVKRLDLFDCDLVNCKGQVRKNYFNVNLNLGYGPWLGALVYGKDYLDAVDESNPRPLVQYSSMLLFNQNATEMERKVAFLGYKLTEALTLALYESYHELEGKKSEGQYVVGNYKNTHFSYIVGAGTFGSDYNEKTFAAFVKVSWLLDPSLSLND